ncbi:branched-chain amino acid ABC transporter permease [Gordonia sp. NPDC058843]|uniref:branched-chain amino acid ABC transporter permease n=1 Tax=Gordonia sp. NPDC058843 TaxID=3346648 RepID=UPI0036AA3355
MSDLVLILVAALGLASLIFLLASGLSLIFGLMRVLSFAHGCFLTLSAYMAWLLMKEIGTASTGGLVLGIVVAMAAGAVVSLVTEVLVIRPLRGRELEQLLATVGISIAVVALLTGIWGPDQHLVEVPGWLRDSTEIFGAAIPNVRFALIGAAAVVLIAIKVLLSRTRYGITIRAGVENREMVSALGIDVQRSFTLVFTIGGLLAGLAGALTAVYYRGVTPYMGDELMILAFIVLIVGGLGSIEGAAIAAVALATAQALANFYIDAGAGDIVIVVLMLLTLLIRPQGILGQKGRLA